MAEAPGVTAGVDHRMVETNGIRMHIAEAGTGPLVLMLHGFPEGWYSWRHQLAALADAGFRAVAPDQRGYGQTDRPEQVEKYSMFHLVGDVIGLLSALDTTRAVIVGHDWGAPVAWNTALWRPDRVLGVAGLSVPVRPRGPRPPTVALRETLGERFYQIYFQEPGVAEREFQLDVRKSLRRVLFGLSGNAPSISDMMVAEDGFVATMPQDPSELPAWLTDADLDYMVHQYELSGFSGGLNWYRNLDRNWELSAPWQGGVVSPPALYMLGDREIALGALQAVKSLGALVPNLRQAIVLEDCGHWIQQERPAEVSSALINFARAVQPR